MAIAEADQQQAAGGRSPEVVVETRNLTKVYRDFWGRQKVRALKALDLEVRQGEIFVRSAYLPDLRIVQVEVQDNGTGIETETSNQLFDPYTTTKDHGTGLGLSISHNIIKAHQGTIDVENEVGKGARFILKIPCWDHELDKK